MADLSGNSFPISYIKGGETKRLRNPDMPIKYGVSTNSLVIVFESGHEQRRKKGIPKKTFDLTFSNLDLEAATCLEDFFYLMGGPVAPFTWTDPSTNKVYNVRFDGDSFTKEYVTHTRLGPLFTVTIKLVQVI